MVQELDKKKVKKDLESWAKKLQDIDKLTREIYSEIQEVYKGVKEE